MKAYKQQLHGIPQYKILDQIIKMNRPGTNGKKRWATSKRIAKEIGETVDYVGNMLKYYWSKYLVKRLSIKTPSQLDNVVDGSSHHWVITKKGMSRYRDLTEIFGDISQYYNNHLMLISVQPGKSSCDQASDRIISNQFCPPVPVDPCNQAGQNRAPESSGCTGGVD